MLAFEMKHARVIDSRGRRTALFSGCEPGDECEQYEWVGGDGAFPEARALQYFPLRWQT